MKKFITLSLILFVGQSLAAEFTLKKESAHFRVFTQIEDPAIDEVLQRAETVFAKTVQQLSATVNNKIDIHLFPSVEEFHQFFGMKDLPQYLITQTKKGVVFIVSPSNPGPCHRHDSIVLYLGGSVVRAVMDHMPKLVSLPRWFKIGYGLYVGFDDDAVSASNASNYGVTALKKAAIEDQLPTFNELSSDESVKSIALRGPIEYHLVKLLIERHGISAIPSSIANFGSFKDITGFSPEAFYAQWVESVKKSL